MRQREKDKIRNRRLLLEAAEKLFAFNGFAMTKIEDVAEEAGFSKATVYNYFDNKEDLFIALIERKFEQMVQESEDVFKSDEPFEKVVEEYIRTSLNIIGNNPNFYRIMMSEFYRFSPEFITDKIRPRVHNVIMEFRIRLSAYFRKNSSYFRPNISPEDAAAGLSGIISSIMGQWLFAEEEFELESKTEVIMDLFFNGAINPDRIDKETK